jgi:dihydroorotate dehydrogenase (NAD+) catalytic subunit
VEGKSVALKSEQIDLSCRIGGLTFSSPLLAASGTWAYGLEFIDHPVQKWMGGFVTKSLSLNPSEGNPMPRLYEGDGVLLNSIGLQNIGIFGFLSDVDPQLKSRSSTYVLSVYANRIEDFEALAEKANASSAAAVELNISCPNIEKGGLEFSSDPQTTSTVVSRVKRLLRKPLWVKLSPNVTSIVDIALAAEGAGADALSMINTLVGMAIDVDSQSPWLGKLRGGVSGPGIRPIAVERIFRTYEKVKIPIVGMGGARSARDVLELMMAGAACVQIGTWNFRDPFCYEEIDRDLRSYLARLGFSKVSDVVGRAHRAA